MTKGEGVVLKRPNLDDIICEQPQITWFFEWILNGNDMMLDVMKIEIMIFLLISIFMMTNIMMMMTMMTLVRMTTKM